MRSTQKVEKYIDLIRKQALEIAKLVKEGKIEPKKANAVANQLRISAQMTSLEFRVLKAR